jgi:PAS domain S-box-containing protein
MTVGRPISEICRELAESAQSDQQEILAQLLRMAALEAAETGTRHDERDASVRDLLVGTWDWDISSNKIYADARFAGLFGISPELASTGTPLQLWLDAIHPDDVADVGADINRALTTGSVFSREYRVIADGEVCWVYARGKCTHDHTGRAVRFTGAIVDITAEKADEHHPSIVPN